MKYIASFSYNKWKQAQLNIHVFIPHVGILSYMIALEMECLCIKATFLMVFPYLIIWN